MRLVWLLMSFVSGLAQARGLIWHDFDVAVSDALGVGKERVAVLLRAKINDLDCRVQLDTGAAGAIIWHHVGEENPTADPMLARVQIGDVVKMLPADTMLMMRLKQTGCDGVIATVGNGFFDHGTLHLDLGSERFAFNPAPGLARNRSAQPMLYLRATTGGGHPLVQVSLANGAHGQVLLDTGSMRFGLVATDQQQWRQLTGGGQGGLTRTFSIGNAIEGGLLACEEAETAALMTLGGQTLRQHMLTYCPGKRFQLEQPLLGVLGLRPLARRTLVIDYVSSRWLLGAEMHSEL